jgi:hypothetical protein
MHIKKVHQEIKDFEWNIWQLKFETRSNLNTHIRYVHVNQRPLECDLFQSKLRNESSLRTHRNKFHNTSLTLTI